MLRVFMIINFLSLALISSLSLHKPHIIQVMHFWFSSPWLFWQYWALALVASAYPFQGIIYLIFIVLNFLKTTIFKIRQIIILSIFLYLKSSLLFFYPNWGFVMELGIWNYF